MKRDAAADSERAGAGAGTGADGWSEGLCDCHRDPATCVAGAACLPCLLVSNHLRTRRALAPQRAVSLWGCTDCYDCACLQCAVSALCCCWPCFFGQSSDTLRAKYGLPSEPCDDVLVHCFCSPCAACQEAAELRARNLPALTLCDDVFPCVVPSILWASRVILSKGWHRKR
jgi:Cys-rich protein (TIGR01571 family)